MQASLQPKSHGSIAAASVAAIVVCSLASAAWAQGSAAAEARAACETALRQEVAGNPAVSSRGACRQALGLGKTPEDLRNEVASATQPRANLTLEGLVAAATLADAAVDRMPSAPWGYLARCDLAGRLGSASLMAACMTDLGRVAAPGVDGVPTFVKTGAPAGIWALRALLAFVLLGTLGHALWRRRREARRSVRGPVLAAAFLSATSLFAGAAQATVLKGDNLSGFQIDDADPEASVPSPQAQLNNPLQFGYYLQDLAAKAEKASKKGDHVASARYYGALVKAAPTVAYGPRQMCAELEAAGDTTKAIQACRTAITRLGSTVSDYVRFVQMVLATKGPLPTGERQELNLVIDHMKQEPSLGYLPQLLGCEVAIRFDDFTTVKSCAGDLAKVAPKDPRVITLQWALAIHNFDRSAAVGWLSRARSSGITPDGLARMETATRAMTRQWAKRLVLLAFAIAAVGAGLWFSLRQLSNRRQAAA
jgi:hypothetical protein